VARSCGPSVIFIDEIDSLVSSRDADNEHEASRRLKNEFFSMFDGVTSTGALVMVLGSTNCPWDLDEAARRRFEKRVYIPLPSTADRLAQFRLAINAMHVDETVTPATLSALIDDGMCYSGADIHVLCREAAMEPVRRMLSEMSPQDIVALRASCDGSIPALPPVTISDFRKAMESTKPSVDKESITRFDLWNKQFGSGTSK